MKVNEFIEELQKCDQEKEVLIGHSNGFEAWDESAKINETDYYVYIE